MHGMIRAWNEDSRTGSNFTENCQKIAPGSFLCAQIYQHQEHTTQQTQICCFAPTISRHGDENKRCNPQVFYRRIFLLGLSGKVQWGELSLDLHGSVELYVGASGVDPGFYKTGGAQIKDWQNFGACRNGGVWGGCAPSEAEKICNFQS